MKKISFFLILVIAISVWLSSCELINFNNDSDEKFDVEIILHTENGDLNISKNGGPIVSTSWEPALIETAYISVKNNTSVDLKCDIALEAANIVNNLNEVLTFIAVPDATFDTPVSHKTLDWSASNNISIGNNLAIQNVTIAPGGEYFFAISLRMDETAGNEYQGGDVDFNIKVLTDAIAQNNEN
jgi:hypothetical protein